MSTRESRPFDTALGRRRQPTIAVIVLLGLMVAGAVAILHAGRGTTFYFDEWDFITGRRGVSVDTLLGGHNGHLSLIPVLIYKALLQVVGLDAYWPYRLVLLACHLAVVGLLFALLRRRTGDAVAVCLAALVLFLGSAFHDLLWAFQIGFDLALAFGLGALLALDRDTRGGDAVAAVLLLLALASASIGIPFAIVVIADLALRRRWRRLVRVAAAPLVLYALWRLGWGTSDASAGNLDDAPAYAFRMLAAAVGGLSGLGVDSTGPTLAVAAIAGVALALARGLGGPRFGALVLGAVALWGLTAVARAQLGDPQANRYIYPSAVLVLLAAAELWPRAPRLDGRAIAVVAALTAIACLGNLQALNSGGDTLRSISGPVRAELRAVEDLGPRVPFAFVPDPGRAPQIQAGTYLSAVRAFGSPALTEAELVRAPEPQREAADEVFRRVALTPPAPAAIPRKGAAGCRVLTPRDDVAVPRGGLRIATARGDVVEVRLRRYADAFPADVNARVGDGASLLRLEPDGGSRPWRVQVRGSRPARACAVG